MITLLLPLALAGEPDVLLVGNSYVFTQHLDTLTAELLVAGGQPDAAVEALAEAGYTWADHAARAAEDGSPWQDALVTGATAWDAVVLQEQSQILGFPETSSYRVESLAAADTLDGYVAAMGGETFLLLTWGRLHGDESNPDLYPDYVTMQARLTEGTLATAAALSTEDRPGWVAPAGLAWQAVYEAVEAEGGDPTADGSAFAALYGPDGSHPSVAGGYLTAAVIYASLTGESPVGLPGPEVLDVDTLAALQATAAEVVLGQGGLDYPWTEGGEDSGDEGGGDEGSGAEDSGAEDSGDEGDEGAGGGPTDTGDVDKGRCGCAAAGGAVGAPLVALVLVFAGRRRQR